MKEFLIKLTEENKIASKNKSSFGFQYISNQGGIKTKELKIKNIN
jgi:hypothetical protein